MPEAMKLIRNELGNDAVILNSRVIQTGGILGFFKKRMIEVIAALDDKSSTDSIRTARSETQLSNEVSTSETYSQIGKKDDIKKKKSSLKNGEKKSLN